MRRKKLCTKCGKEKDKDNFYKNKRRLDGLSPWCKECRKELTKKYYKKKM